MFIFIYLKSKEVFVSAESKLNEVLLLHCIHELLEVKVLHILLYFFFNQAFGLLT